MRGKRRVRVAGLVRLAERVRSEAGRGLNDAGRAALASEVERALDGVHAACARLGARANELPAPSRNAYRFLRGLDLDGATLGTEPLRPALKVRAVVATAERLITTLAETDTDVAVVSAAASAAAKTVGERLSRHGRDAASLPTRSRTALETLTRLSDEGVARSLRASAVTLHQVLRTRYRLRWPNDTRPVRVSFAPCAVLWLWYGVRERVTLTVSVQFFDAPSEILEQLVRWCLGGDRGNGRRAVDAWLVTRSSPASETLRAPRGLVYDLEAMFHDLNRDHFGGRLGRPRIEWSSRPTFAKFGHYTYADDRLVLSSSLDQPVVPREVVRYVLFHELLHKELGETGSCRGHGREFRRREREFPDYEAAVSELDRLANSLRRR